MIHLGDITKLHGDAIPPVDCITGGSPCQDLSVAGKRAGLAGERSGLFMEQIRIVKEMRNRDIRNGRAGIHVRPRFMVWENVPGAFSSNKGEDFRAVLEEIVKVVEPDAPPVPLPDKGKWPKSGCLYSDLGDWSAAWRVHDAQFWGVPQRRKRIALVADFGGLAAPEILFERESLSRDSEPSGAEREGAAGGTGGGVDSTGWGWHNGTYYMDADIEADPTIRQQGDCIDSTYPTVARSLTQRYDGSPCIDRGPDVVVQNIDSVFCLQGNGIDRADTAGCNGRGWREDQCYTLSARRDGSPQPDKGNGANIVAVHQNASGEVRENDVAYTIGTNANASGRNTPLVYDAREPLCIEMTSTKNTIVEDGISPTLTARMGTGGNQVNAVQQPAGTNIYGSEVTPALVASAFKDPGNTQDGYCIAATSDAESYTQSSFAQYERGVGTLRANGGDLGGGSETLAATNQTVRRLTPLECERLQGFPDGWTDIGDWVDSKGKKHKAADSPRYKALGNSIALPFWFWLLRRISEQYERPATLGSLFDGIGGFPLCWERCNGKGTAIWASEIEEFPIAVTKVHFPEETQT